ncbi:MAG: hypothetical protein AAFZ65_03765 [Planctomycetota bacterium]
MSEPTATSTRKQTALMKRLARMHDHKDFPKAMEHVPPTEEDVERAERRRRGGVVLVVVGLILAFFASQSGTVGAILLGLFAALCLAFGAKQLATGSRDRSQVLANPLERRPALVADRRSETMAKWSGGRTTYYFRLEFDDGSNGEFRYPGRGVQDDLLVKGVTGVAFLRGETLIAWKSIKV